MKYVYLKDHKEIVPMTFESLLDEIQCRYETEVLAKPYYNRDMQELIPQGMFCFEYNGAWEPATEESMEDVLAIENIILDEYQARELKRELSLI